MTRARILADYVAGGTTAAEFDYMDGVTSNVQTQLDAKLALAGGTMTGDLVPATPLSNRNVIINGGFDIWQRATTFASLASTNYTADRWAYLKNGTMVHTISRSTDVPTQAESGYKSNYSMKIDCITADSSIASDVYNFIVQKIEGYNIQPLQGNTVTLSFWIKSTKTGTQTICWRNSGLNMNMIKEYTINTTNTWEKKEITWTFDNSGGTWEYENGIGGWLCWNLASGSNFHTTKDAWQTTSGVMSTSSAVNNTDDAVNDIYLAQVQLELGSSATPFEHRSVGDELAKCQRYFQMIQSNGSNSQVGVAFCWNNAELGAFIPLIVPMRSACSLIAPSGSNHYRWQAGAAHYSSACYIGSHAPNRTGMGTSQQVVSISLYLSSVSVTWGQAGSFYVYGSNFSSTEYCAANSEL